MGEWGSYDRVNGEQTNKVQEVETNIKLLVRKVRYYLASTISRKLFTIPNLITSDVAMCRYYLKKSSASTP